MPIINDLMINEQIRDREVRLVGAEGEQVGIVSIKEAQQLANEKGLDLVKIAPQAKPPVCKIMDYGKYKFDAAKKEKEARKKQKTVSVKEVRLSASIDKHDFETKLRHARKWLEQGMKVKVDMRFRGRLITRVEVGRTTMNQFIEELSDLGSVEKKPKLEGNTMSVVISPLKQN